MIGDNNVQYIQRAGDDKSIGLVIRYESEKVVFGRDNRFYLEIRNRTPDPKHLVLDVEGVKATISDSTTVDLDGGASDERLLTLQLGATEPMAGSVPLRVVVKDADTGQPLVLSDPVTLTVPQRPSLDSELLFEEPVYSGGPYEAWVELSNTGNTELRGRLRALPENSASELGAGRVLFDHSPFHLSPGRGTQIPVELAFPDPGWRSRRWTVLIGADVADHDGVGARTTEGTEVTQYGKAHRLIEWSGQYMRMRRVWFAASAVLFAAVGFLAARLIAPASVEPASPTSTATEPVYFDMRPHCKEGKSVLVLMSLAEDLALVDAQRQVDTQSSRLTQQAAVTPALLPYLGLVKASKRGQMCEATLLTGRLKPTSTITTFVWIGLVPTAEAESLCASLAPPCVPLSTK